MPTFGISQNDLEADMFEDGSDSYFRRFIAPSMAFLRKKKIFRDHAENVELYKELETRKANARERAYTKFEEARRKHEAKFVNRNQNPTPAQLVPPVAPEVERDNLMDKWRRQSIHPSSSAVINVHGVVGEYMAPDTENDVSAPQSSSRPVSVFQPAPVLPPAEPTSVLSEVSLNNSLPSHLYDSSHDSSSFFNSSSVFGDSPHPMPQTKKVFNLDGYTGARPSFSGATASTPISKSFFGNSERIPTIVEQSPLAAATATATGTSGKTTTTSTGGIAAPPAFNFKPAAAPQVTQAPTAPPSTLDFKPATLPPKVEKEKDIVNAPSFLREKPAVQPTVPEVPAAAVPDRQEAGDIGTGEETTSLAGLYAKELDVKEDNDLGCARFENGPQRQLRSAIKRTIIDKISLCAKKLATKEEILTAALFLRNLLKGQAVTGFNDQIIRADDVEVVQYARSCVVDHCLGVIEHDLALIGVVAQILRFLCNETCLFEKVLIGKMMAASPLLTLDREQCSKFAADLTGLNSSDRTFIMNKQKSIIKLFCTLHVTGVAEEGSRFTIGNLWTCLAFTLNSTSSHRVLGTIIVLNMILEIGTEMMSRLYGKQWRKMVALVNKELLPSFEEALLTDDVRRKAGEALYISVLRNILETM